MNDDESGDFPEFQSGYASAPAWYWRMAGWLGNWRGEVCWWVSLFLIGLVVGLVVGYAAGVTS